MGLTFSSLRNISTWAAFPVLSQQGRQLSSPWNRSSFISPLLLLFFMGYGGLQTLPLLDRVSVLEGTYVVLQFMDLLYVLRSNARSREAN